MATRITLKKIPHYPNVKIENQLADTSKTWHNFLKRHNVTLDAQRYIVYNKSRKMHAYLDSPIQRMIGKFLRRKESVSVVLVKSKLPMLDRVGSPSHNSAALGVRRRRSSRQAENTSSALARPAPAPPAPAPPVIGSRYTYPEDSMRIPTDNRRNDDLPPLLKRQQNFIQGHGQGGQGVNFDSDDDGMSQISQGEDDDDDGTGAILKRQLIQAVQALPPREFVDMREELIHLKESGNMRDYKWIHYAPRTSSWIQSAFRA